MSTLFLIYFPHYLRRQVKIKILDYNNFFIIISISISIFFCFLGL